jgi:transcriptional regulator with AAA-type ATPase domain
VPNAGAFLNPQKLLIYLWDSSAAGLPVKSRCQRGTASQLARRQLSGTPMCAAEPDESSMRPPTSSNGLDRTVRVQAACAVRQSDTITKTGLSQWFRGVACRCVQAEIAGSERAGSTRTRGSIHHVFYRLNVFLRPTGHLPPLSEPKGRHSDAGRVLREALCGEGRKANQQDGQNNLKLCQSYHWPGNIRELQNIIESSVILCTGDTFWIDEAWLSSHDVSRPESSGPLTQNLQHYEKGLIIEAALAESDGTIAGPNGAAAKLGIPRSTLDLKIKHLNTKKHTIR